MAYLNDETGAVTVDWVVLTAAIVGLGLAAMSVVSGGVEDLSGDVEAELSGSTIYTTFDQRTYSRFYEAIVARHAIDPYNTFPDGADAAFAERVETIRNYSDADLVARVQFLQANVDTNWGPASDALNALDRDGATAAEIAAAIGSTEAVVTTTIADSFGGDAGAMIDERLAMYEQKFAVLEANQQEADERGLTY